MKINIKNKQTYLSEIELIFNFFIKSGIDCFYNELKGYIEHNKDFVVIDYANECTLTSMAACGLVRNDRDNFNITILQEYGTTKCSNNGYGRTDLFIKVGNIGIWVESKFDRYGKINRENHWDIEEWLEWDKNEILNQLDDYYAWESKKCNNNYQRHYLLTLSFKKITKKSYEFIETEHQSLEKEVQKKYSRPWYYSFATFYDDDVFQFGIEVYGTFVRKK